VLLLGRLHVRLLVFTPAPPPLPTPPPPAWCFPPQPAGDSMIYVVQDGQMVAVSAETLRGANLLGPAQPDYAGGG